MSTDLQQPHRESQPLSERALRRGLNTNIAAGAAGMLWVATAMGIPLTMFMESINAGGVLIGLTVTVQQLAMVLQVPSSIFSERLATRKLYWATVALLQRMLWFIPSFLPILFSSRPRAMAYVMVGLVATSSVLVHCAAAPWWSWMADLVPDRVRGRFWGRRQSMVTAAHLVAVLLVGYLLDLFPEPGAAGGSFAGFSIVFALGALFGCADIVIHLWVPEPPVTRTSLPTGVLKRITAPFANPDFRWLTLSSGLWTLGIGLVGQYSYLYLKREFAISYTMLSVTTVSASLGVVVAGFIWGYVLDRLGARNVGVVTMVMAPAFGLVWFFMRDVPVAVHLPFLREFSLAQPVLLLVIVNVVAGGFYAGVSLSQVALLGALTGPEGRTMAMAVHWSLVGLLAALGPLVGGVIMDWVQARELSWLLPTGTRFGFFHVLVLLQMAVTWCAAVPCLLKVSRQPGEVGVRTAFSRLMVGNPLRAISNIYNIYSMGASMDSRRRAEAVRKVGSKKTVIAVADLIEKLEDPAAEVREEAALALGRTGSPEAVEALLRKFNDPHSDVMPQIARALREAKSPSTVEALMARLSDTDRETVTEVARALGEIGDRRACDALMRLLRGSEDSKVVLAAGEALVRLGELAAIYEILPRMIATQNMVLKRSLAVAVGDLVGEPGELYRAIATEQRSKGEGASRLLGRLQDTIRSASGKQRRVEADALTAKAKGVEQAYEEGRFGDALDLLLDVATGLATLHYGIGFGDDAAGVVDALIWHNERFGLSVWYLDLLRKALAGGEVGHVGDVDILLGIYALSGWSGSRDAVKV